MDSFTVKSPKTEKRSLSKNIRFIISVFLIVVLGYGIFNYVPFVSKYKLYVIVTGSMEPVINVDDIVIIDSSKTVEDFNVGDIIAFTTDINNDGTDEVLVHYLYSKEIVNDHYNIKTKSEISDTPDNYLLTESDILGKHVLTIRKFGSFLMFATSTLGKIILIIDIIIIYILVEMFSSNKKNKEIKGENNDSNNDVLKE